MIEAIFVYDAEAWPKNSISTPASGKVKP